MDTVSIKIAGVEKFTLNKWAEFNHELKFRVFNELTDKDMRKMRGNPAYLRSFILQSKPERGTAPSVVVYEKVNLLSRSLWYEVVVTVSIPNLVFETNLKEVREYDFSQVKRTLHRTLYNMGIEVSEDAIAQSRVSVVNFCKNIILPQELSFRSIIKELSKVDIGKAYDTTTDLRTKDTNSAEILHLYCGNREWSFYEKIADVRKKTRNKSKRTLYEKQKISEIEFGGFEVFRLEYRLKKNQTIRSEVSKLLGKSSDEDITFQELFSENLWKEVLWNSWKRIIRRPENQLALIGSENSLDLLNHIFSAARNKKRNGHSENQAFWVYGLISSIKDHGAKTIRNEVGRIWSEKASGKRFDDKCVIATSLTENVPISQGISFISTELEKFTFNTVDYLL